MKENGKMAALNRKNNYKKSKKILNHNIFKTNKERLLLVSKYKLDIMICTMRDN